MPETERYLIRLGATAKTDPSRLLYHTVLQASFDHIGRSPFLLPIYLLSPSLYTRGHGEFHLVSLLLITKPSLLTNDVRPTGTPSAAGLPLRHRLRHKMCRSLEETRAFLHQPEASIKIFAPNRISTRIGILEICTSVTKVTAFQLPKSLHRQQKELAMYDIPHLVSFGANVWDVVVNTTF